MARKPQHYTEHTSSEIHELFESTITAAGMGRLAAPEREQHINAVVMDGVPFGDRKAEVRKPGSDYYATSYLEARSTASMLVDLGIAGDVVNVLRGDAPDVRVELRGGKWLYVEQAMVMDSAARRLSIIVEDANIATYEQSRHDEYLRRVFDGGIFMIKLSRFTDLERRCTKQDFTDETLRLARTITSALALRKLDALEYPTLHAFGAGVLYRPCPTPTVWAIQSPLFHGRAAELEPALRDILTAKIAKAARYETNGNPLWLLLDIDMHFDVGPAALRDAAAHVFSDLPQSRFERIVLQQVRYSPLVLKRRSFQKTERCETERLTRSL